jgi:hypothetical protein
LHGDDGRDDPEGLYADEDVTYASIVPTEESELEVSNIVADFQAETQLLALQNGDQLPEPPPLPPAPIDFKEVRDGFGEFFLKWTNKNSTPKDVYLDMKEPLPRRGKDTEFDAFLHST